MTNEQRAEPAPQVKVTATQRRAMQAMLDATAGAAEWHFAGGYESSMPALINAGFVERSGSPRPFAQKLHTLTNNGTVESRAMYRLAEAGRAWLSDNPRPTKRNQK